AELNHWLNSAETLNLGYSLRSKSVISQAAYTGGGDTSSELQALLETFGDSLRLGLSEADADGNPLPEEHSVSLAVLKKLLEADKDTTEAKARQLVTKEFHNKWVLWDHLNNIGRRDFSTLPAGGRSGTEQARHHRL
ncbi:hypothetical protein QOZ28_30820, partial [Pseudomonas aeruginosa]|uniref:hypothetical protein n=1 Tax=Pseudomonas aeruginosa TaxID=287 RepID=UPI00345AAD44